MELLQLKYFCEAAKTENLSETAKKFYVPTSNISNSIKRLENELGCTLFDHFSNKISLNDRGKAFYGYISHALNLIDDAKTHMKDIDQKLRGEIHLRCKSNRRSVTAAMEKFLKVHPEVKFRMTFGEVKLDNADLIISYDLPLEYSERIFILEEDVPIAMRRDHPLASKDDLTIKDLKDESFITGLSIETKKACNEAGFIPNVAFETNDPTYVRKYVEMGLGIAFIPYYSWAHLFSDNIVFKHVGIKRSTYAFTPPNKYKKRAVSEFINFLLEETKDARVDNVDFTEN